MKIKVYPRGGFSFFIIIPNRQKGKKKMKYTSNAHKTGRMIDPLSSFHPMQEFFPF